MNRDPMLNGKPPKTAREIRRTLEAIQHAVETVPSGTAHARDVYDASTLQNDRPTRRPLRRYLLAHTTTTGWLCGALIGSNIALAILVAGGPVMSWLLIPIASLGGAACANRRLLRMRQDIFGKRMLEAFGSDAA